ASEIHRFYDMKTVVIPQNLPCIRKDHEDSVFTSLEAKTKALIKEIGLCHVERRPVLVGTASVEESEELSSALERAGIPCRVLNAKNDELEANIIAQAGRPGTVTISTNMAGRGVDIKLGGETEEERDEVINLGGLYVIGTNRHESVRIDNQLRGRSGRQGDPGSTRFFTSLEDNLVQRYGIKKLLPEKLRNVAQDAPLADPRVNREISRGQRIIEGQNFEIRKTLLKYSDIVEKQRSLVQQHRQKILLGGLRANLLRENDRLQYSRLENLVGRERLDEVERQIILYQIDRLWAEHLAFVTDIKEGIHLTGVSGNSPLFEFQKIIHSEFLDFEKNVEEGVIRTFRSLSIIDDKIDLEKEGIGRPSSTWTYVISDNQFGLWVQLLSGSNIGAVSAAAAFYGPLLLLLGIVRRYFGKTGKTGN
ncbi:MAG: hypothetical protein KOO63_02075, partial [Bacteroidales bacterium]|nr:hypothetical protein [Candidatus Latescibacterota bacterium]